MKMPESKILVNPFQAKVPFLSLLKASPEEIPRVDFIMSGKGKKGTLTWPEIG